VHSEKARYYQAKKVTLLGALTNVLLGVMKLVGGIAYHSHGLVADGLHSFSDLISDFLVLFASKYGSLNADANHPYGHQRIETAATLFLALLLIVAGLAIVWSTVDEFIYHDARTPQWLSLPIIIVSILANELLFYYTRYIGKTINSQLIITNAWHHRSDAASSLVVLLGLIGALAGAPYLDALAAALIGVLIIKMGWHYAWNSTKELVDTAVDTERLEQITAVIQSVQGVKKIHQLRSRLMASDIFIDVHILVDPKITVSEGHYIAQHVHQSLVAQIGNVKDVTVHVDPEDDEVYCPSLHLPSRSVLQELLEQVHIDFPQILFWNIHYLAGKIKIDFVCAAGFKEWVALKKRVMTALDLQKDIAEVRLLRLQEKIRS